MDRVVAGLVLVFVMVSGGSCSDSGGDQDAALEAPADVDIWTADLAEPDADSICVPSCEGLACGDDGCGGSCGTCEGGMACTAAGACAQIPCESSKDCPGDLVCASSIGRCAECVGDEDCPAEGAFCGSDFVCHVPSTCQSDKDCKDLGQVCDKAAGVCVDCVHAADCGEGLVCVEGYCAQGLCNPGELACHEETVQACSEKGDGWVTQESCAPDRYCEAGACHDFACVPEKVWCEEDVYMVCAADGKSIQFQEDCSLKGQYCFAGACVDSVCEPSAKFCVDGDTAAVCSPDGLQMSQADCPAGTYCLDGDCPVWVCDPGMVVCVDNAAKTCALDGSGYSSETDCTTLGKTCVGGQCTDQVCAPGTDGCKGLDTVTHCAEDGKSFTEEPCEAFTTCVDGSCEPWVCTPSTPMCNGSWATVCAENGLGAAAGGTNCALASQACENGVCVVCEPECTDVECGDDGCGGSCGSCGEDETCFSGTCVMAGETCDDGNEVDWDGCTQGLVSEFLVSPEGVQCKTPKISVLSNGGLGITYSRSDGDSDGIKYRLYGPTGESVTEELQANVYTVGAQTTPDIAGLKDDRVLLVWNSVNQDGSSGGIFGRIFDLSGGPLTAEFGINSATVNSQHMPALATGGSEGTYVVAWATSWTNNATLGAALFQLDGMKIVEFNPTAGQNVGKSAEPDVAMLPSGNFGFAWEASNDVYARFYDASGQAITGAIKANAYAKNNQLNPSIAAVGNDRYVVAWDTPDLDGDTWGTYAALITEDGSIVDADFKLHTILAGTQKEPSLVGLTDGGYLAAWLDTQNDGNQSEAMAQRFDATNDKSGEPFTLHLNHSQQQVFVDLTGYPDGEFAAVWLHSSGWDTGYVFARRFDADGNPIYH